MDVALVHDAELGDYRFPGAHPLRPERFLLAVALMRAWGLLAEDDGREAHGHARVLGYESASDEALTDFHTPEYVAAVKAASETANTVGAVRYGIGPGDTPAFEGMHRAAARAVGATSTAVETVLSGAVTRAYVPAGGLHHAHSDHASGFCIYNDIAVALRSALRTHPGVRVAYIDIDAHHGDGVEAAFADVPDVLTLSAHESGRFLFPGTGRVSDVGEGAGYGHTVDFPLMPLAGEESYRLVTEHVIVPAVERFSPDLIVLQAGADSHRNDPLTHLHNSVRCFDATVAQIVAAADETCGGRIVATGGGGYDTFWAVPRMWACVLCRLLGADPPQAVPAPWEDEARVAANRAGTPFHDLTGTYDEYIPDQSQGIVDDLTRETRATIDRLVNSHPLFA